MTDTAYEVFVNQSTFMVRGGTPPRFLGAFGTNFYRSYVFPLYTPSGQTVVREFPFDHPFHNGVFVGQHPVTVDGREGNYWAIPVKRSNDDHINVRIGRMDPQGTPVAECGDDHARLTLNAIWCDEADEPLLAEQRSVCFHARPDATICDMFSDKSALYGDVVFGKTKWGSVGIRVEPRLLPALGGEVIGCTGDELRRGRADDVANLMACDAVAYEANVPGAGVYGVCQMILDNSLSDQRDGPWFIRDYGMAMFNATQQETLHLAQGDNWRLGLRVVAYDGPVTADRIAAWRKGAA